MAEKQIDGKTKTALELGPVLAFFVAYLWLKDRTFTIAGTEYAGFVVVTAGFYPRLSSVDGGFVETDWAFVKNASRYGSADRCVWRSQRMVQRPQIFQDETNDHLPAIWWSIGSRLVARAFLSAIGHGGPHATDR